MKPEKGMYLSETSPSVLSLATDCAAELPLINALDPNTKVCVCVCGGGGGGGVQSKYLHFVLKDSDTLISTNAKCTHWHESWHQNRFDPWLCVGADNCMAHSLRRTKSQQQRLFGLVKCALWRRETTVCVNSLAATGPLQCTPRVHYRPHSPPPPPPPPPNAPSGQP